MTRDDWLVGGLLCAALFSSAYLIAATLSV
jgi:hypothetical protein